MGFILCVDIVLLAGADGRINFLIKKQLGVDSVFYSGF